MLNFLASLILASLFIPSGFNFFTQKAIDYSYGSPVLPTLSAPQRMANKSFGLKTTAKSILIVDDASGKVLYNKNSGQALPIASVSKLMTALVVLDTKPDWEKTIKITAADRRDGGQVYLLPGDEIKFKELFSLMLVGSANEAAAAIARTAGIDDFVSAMNKKAVELKMADTYFLDSSGLSAQNVSSAADLLKLANAAFAKPEIVKAVTTPVYGFKTLNNQRPVKAISTDKLLSSFLDTGEYKIVAGKTGYINEAGYCLLFRVKKNDTQSLTVVLLGTETITDRWQEAKGLVDWVFRNYVWP